MTAHEGQALRLQTSVTPSAGAKEESFVCSARSVLSVVILITTSENYEQDF